MVPRHSAAACAGSHQTLPPVTAQGMRAERSPACLAAYTAAQPCGRYQLHTRGGMNKRGHIFFIVSIILAG